MSLTNTITYTFYDSLQDEHSSRAFPLYKFTTTDTLPNTSAYQNVKITKITASARCRTNESAGNLKYFLRAVLYIGKNKDDVYGYKYYGASGVNSNSKVESNSYVQFERDIELNNTQKTLYYYNQNKTNSLVVSNNILTWTQWENLIKDTNFKLGLFCREYQYSQDTARTASEYLGSFEADSAQQKLSQYSTAYSAYTDTRAKYPVKLTLTYEYDKQETTPVADASLTISNLQAINTTTGIQVTCAMKAENFSATPTSSTSITILINDSTYYKPWPTNSNEADLEFTYPPANYNSNTSVAITLKIVVNNITSNQLSTSSVPLQATSYKYVLSTFTATNTTANGIEVNYNWSSTTDPQAKLKISISGNNLTASEEIAYSSSSQGITYFFQNNSYYTSSASYQVTGQIFDSNNTLQVSQTISSTTTAASTTGFTFESVLLKNTSAYLELYIKLASSDPNLAVHAPIQVYLRNPNTYSIEAFLKQEENWTKLLEGVTYTFVPENYNSETSYKYNIFVRDIDFYATNDITLQSVIDTSTPDPSDNPDTPIDISDSVLLELSNTGNGVAIGQHSTATAATAKFECAYPAYFSNGIALSDGTIRTSWPTTSSETKTTKSEIEAMNFSNLTLNGSTISAWPTSSSAPSMQYGTILLTSQYGGPRIFRRAINFPTTYTTMAPIVICTPVLSLKSGDWSTGQTTVTVTNLSRTGFQVNVYLETESSSNSSDGQLNLDNDTLYVHWLAIKID